MELWAACILLTCFVAAVLAASLRRAPPAEGDDGREGAQHAVFPAGNTKTRTVFAVCLIAACLGIGVGFYGAVGAPGLASIPREVLADWGMSEAARLRRQEFREIVAKLEKRVKTAPDDGTAWQYLSLVRLQQNRLREAGEAFARANRLNGIQGAYVIRYMVALALVPSRNKGKMEP
ncbi:MAG: hypothetical protein LBR29_08850 [Methylobacteriaceae bacterium]|jgi:cytochrome c-type biogenesis protein CcmH/NrfG|nr:hypothetical protein [Methylobacteriaceae bacterium]